MCKTQILQQHARRILAHSNRSCLFRSYGTVSAAAQNLPSRIVTNSNQNAHITPVLESWQKQGHQVKPSDLRGLIKNLRDSNQFSKALEASKWMGEQKVFDIVPEDYSARLHLVENVLGLEEAEKFFKSIPKNMRDYSVYATLLSSYTKSENTLDKAEATFEKMRELGFLLKPSPFNSMISLYGQLQKLDMVEKLVREMQETKVECDSPTVNNVLRVYADTCKIKAMETFKTSVDEQVIKLEEDTIVAMAKAYLRYGSIEKAIEMYGNVAGSEKEVYRLWDEYKKETKVNDNGYRTVLSSLLKLDDVQGAEKIYEEWKPEGPKLDMSIPSLLLSRYYAEGMEMKIDQMVKSIRKKRYEMHFKKIKERLIFLRRVIVGMGLKVEQMVKSIRQKKFKEPLILLEAREAKIKEMVTFIKKKRFGMHLHKLKESLIKLGQIVMLVGLIVAILVVIVGALVINVAWNEWLIQQHPPTSYWKVRILKDNPMLYYFLFVRK
ncbi:Pentatricopeptide repeat [Arabidopsis suecica]|uniref:Pentatricopeptide repeat n=1 Tax=Arabidopsis suecica TaxID=45249 RepID=A0A8T1YMS7_ARASU|nr:Pentatricopeptide repeat [Arabidopsis suecica]